MKNALTLFLAFLCVIQSLNAQDETLKGKEYIIYSHSDSFNFWEESNAAILISDKDSITELKELFYNNELIAEYKCGYNYQIQFMNNNGKEIGKKLHLNTECDMYKRDHKKISEFIDSFISRIKNYPTHYIYNLKVNVEISVDNIIDLLRKDNFEAFLLTDYREQFPKLKLVYCEPDSNDRTLDDAERRFKEIDGIVRLKVQPIDSSSIYRSTKWESKYVDYKTNLVSRIYYFPTKTNINSIKEQVTNLKIDHLFTEECSQYYYLQLLSKNNDLEDISSLLKKYSFVEDVTAAKKGFLNKECDLYSGY